MTWLGPPLPGKCIICDIYLDTMNQWVIWVKERHDKSLCSMCFAWGIRLLKQLGDP